MTPHLHRYKFECCKTNGHTHRMVGCTDNMIGVNAVHFHFFDGISSYTNHTHYFSGFTGLPIRTENGHIHKIEGILETNSMHEHKFSNITMEDISYNKPGIRNWAIGLK